MGETVMIATREGMVPVACFYRRGGLAVTGRVQSQLDSGLGQSWNVTHIGTGMAVPMLGPWAYPEVARRAVDYVLRRLPEFERVTTLAEWETWQNANHAHIRRVLEVTADNGDEAEEEMDAAAVSAKGPAHA
jgi:hypothetical protein